MKGLPETSEQQEPSFKDFLSACLNGDIEGDLTFDQWKQRRKTPWDSLRDEYSKYCTKVYAEAKGDISKIDNGNFYDWLAEIKGFKLTREETGLRIHKQ